MGTPASIAMKNAPFLNGPGCAVVLRVPSGAIASEMPWRSASIAGRSAWIAFSWWKRSMKTVPASDISGPKIGFFLISCLPMPTKSRRSSLQMTSMSIADWWLKMNTAGRRAQTFSSPRTCTSRPASAVPSSPHVDDAMFTACCQLPLSAAAGRPIRNDGKSAPIASPVRTICSAPGKPRLVKLCVGHLRRAAMVCSARLGLVGRGLPTASSSGRSSSLSV